MKTLRALLVALVLTIGMAGLGHAAEARGKIVSITGAHDFDVKDKSGKVSHREEVLPAGFKVGDMVTVKDGKVTKDDVQDTAPETPAKKTK
ncbi:MAG: hypothetical protein L7F78_24365 [Syntrophales bacterium LBB04]|nr:hypothetical protein [Syntrophales bacterium LBB04]